MPTPIEQLQQQLQHQKRTLDMVHQQGIQNRNGGKRKREAIELWMKDEVATLRNSIATIEAAMDLLAPGQYDEDIAQLTATLATLVDNVQGMKKEGMASIGDLAHSTSERLKAIDKLLNAYSAPRGMEKRLADADLRMDRLEGSIAKLGKRLA